MKLLTLASPLLLAPTAMAWNIWFAAQEGTVVEDGDTSVKCKNLPDGGLSVLYFEFDASTEGHSDAPFFLTYAEADCEGDGEGWGPGPRVFDMPIGVQSYEVYMED